MSDACYLLARGISSSLALSFGCLFASRLLLGSFILLAGVSACGGPRYFAPERERRQAHSIYRRSR
ncbi:hypothetical protein [Sodalis-like endosymbiont of Proechinophthirus fluctus]|uniref:hypothetical protein n=1 Tax=Sodalis-like endosymbiont of Proechinophthirus fluctus TaxID=1462730 RepID=UPI000A7A5BCF|nr:hypothetical protein [Sodalis-like endosymbiont of Proechinophthirus fluctus]